MQTLTFSTPSDADTVTCHKYAAVDGSDSATGTSSAPFRTAQKLADSLAKGQVGCLKAGTYTEADKELKISKAGVTLRSETDQSATIKARVYVPRGADGVTVRDLKLDGSGGPSLDDGTYPSPTINADYTKFVNNDITNNHTGICFVVGNRGWGIATRTLIQNNRIHDCGRLPRTNHDHGIYVEAARNTRIIGNTIYDNADRGIQLYPDARGSLIQSNIIDGNGEGIIFSGDGGYASSNNTVRRNLITNSTTRYNSEHWWPSGNPIGHGNALYSNCVYGGVRGDNGHGGILWTPVGYTATNNINKDPLYVDRAAKDFRLRSESPCSTVYP